MNMKASAQILILSALGLLGCSYLPETLPGSDGLAFSENQDYIVLQPAGSGDISPTGLIIYPGGLVDPHAYMDWAAEFATSGSGHQVVIAKMPANLAVTRSGAARRITRSLPMDRWVIAGHSLGGAMACSMVDREQDLFEALVLMAAYPGSSTDLSSWPGEVLSISASEDLVVDSTTLEKSRDLLPPGTRYLEITGGNHAGFGSYGPQKGDGEPLISAKEQQQILVEMLQSFYEEHGWE